MTKKDPAKLKSAHSFEIELWSKKHYGGEKRPNKAKINIWNGFVRDNKTGKDKKFHSIAKLLQALEDFYFEDEKRRP
jgi:hypothetical protein